MRLWSFHMKYLDSVGLSRLINEGISGYKALTGQQKMWQNHSQLIRFKHVEFLFKEKPSEFLQSYLKDAIFENLKRKCNEIDFDFIYRGAYSRIIETMKVTTGQLKYEWQHYLKKLQKRNPKKYEELKHIEIPEPHPMFKVIEGDVESWEKVKHTN